MGLSNGFNSNKSTSESLTPQDAVFAEAEEHAGNVTRRFTTCRRLIL